MMKSELKPRERIIRAIGTLFYRDGFRNTGIREIIAESETHKASLYNHFKGKDDLVRAYLQHRSDILAGFLGDLAARSSDPARFFRFWQGALYQSAKAGELHGCPLANINAELGHERVKFREDLTAVANRWLEILKNFLRREQRGHRIDGKIDVHEAGRLIMIIYEGHLQAYSLSGDRTLLGTMAADMMRVLK